MSRFLIKARAKAGDWLSGYYVQHDGKHFIITESGGFAYPFQIDPDTICRSLDRYDIHGTLIFENDHIRNNEVVGNHLDHI